MGVAKKLYILIFSGDNLGLRSALPTVNPFRVKLLTTVGKQQQKFKQFILYSISVVIHSQIDILAVS